MPTDISRLRLSKPEVLDRLLTLLRDRFGSLGG
jgi:hypothetical protein